MYLREENIKIDIFIKIKINAFARNNIHIRILSSIKNNFNISFLDEFKVDFSLAEVSNKFCTYEQNYDLWI